MLLGQRQTNVQQGVSSVRGFIEVWSSGGSKSTFPVGTLVPWLFLAAALVPSTGICRTVQAEALDCRPCIVSACGRATLFNVTAGTNA